jgi:cytochrome c peroxidase
VGHNALQGGRNEPTVYNAAGHVAQFWDGRAPDVEAQALGPVLNPIEMGMGTGDDVVNVLNTIPGYVEAFAAAFPGEPDPVTFQNFGLAVAAFERGLMTPSGWDAFLDGDVSALTPEEKAGFTAFNEAGCVQCHNGAYVGGSLYQKAGLVNPWFTTKDQGRFDVTGDPSDRMIFKVPSLRNVEETWPYFHDGSVQRLPDAVRLMAWHQTGRELDDAQVASIMTWLRTLTGPVDVDYINEPVLPASPPPVARTAAR